MNRRWRRSKLGIVGHRDCKMHRVDDEELRFLHRACNAAPRIVALSLAPCHLHLGRALGLFVLVAQILMAHLEPFVSLEKLQGIVHERDQQQPDDQRSNQRDHSVEREGQLRLQRSSAQAKQSIETERDPVGGDTSQQHQLKDRLAQLDQSLDAENALEP